MILYIGIAMVAILMAGLVRPVAASPVGRGLFALQASRRQLLNMAAIIFIFTLLFAASALRINVGNDYLSYVEYMHLIDVDAYVITEPGFNTLVKLVYGISGFSNYLAVFAVIAFATVALFMYTVYRDSEDFWFSFFLFMVFGYYFQSLNSIRYYLALAIAVFAIHYVLEKKWLHFLLLILLAATFQRSVLAVLPLYVLASLPWKKWMLILAGLFCTSFLFMQDFYLRVMVYLYPSYRDSEFLVGRVSVANIVRCGAVLVFSLIYYRQAIAGHARNRFYFYCNLGALVLYTCCSFIPEISRFGYFLTVTHMFFLPAIIRRIEDRRQRRFFTGVVIAAGLLFFAMFLVKAGEPGVRILPYRSFIFNDLPRIFSISS